MSVRDPLNSPDPFDSSKTFTDEEYLLELNNFASVKMRHIVPPPGMEAADVVQEAVLEAAGSLGLYDRSLPFLPWAATILNRVVATWQRHVYADKRGGRRTESLGSHDHADGRQDFEREVASREELARVLALIGELSDQDREILMLRGLEDLSYREIAELTCMQEPAIRKRVQVARARLQKLSA